MSEAISQLEPNFAAFIAIDWADREHAWALQVAGSTERETGKLAHTPEAIQAWALQWLTRFEGRPVAVALEQARGPLLYALSQYPHLVLYPIHPSTSHDYRKAMVPSGSKDDPGDAGLLLDLLTLHRDRLRMLQADNEQTRKLNYTVEKRRQLVDERTAQTNRIRDLLKAYFPQVLDWFDELHAPILAAFLQRWPTLPDVQKEQPETLRTFFYQHGSRSRRRIDERLDQMQRARPAIRDAAVIEPSVLVVRTLLAVVAALNAGIREAEKEIEQLSQSHPDFFIFSSFPGAGPNLAPRLLVAFGTQRDRYRTASEIQSFSGIAPVTEKSGKKNSVRFRWACPDFLRQTFHEYAAVSIQFCDWAREFYDRQKDKGKEHHAAVRSLAYKWIRILFRCWKSGQAYDDALYVAVRAARAVPLKHKTSLGQAKPAPREHVPVAAKTCGKPKNSQLKTVGEILKTILAEA